METLLQPIPKNEFLEGYILRDDKKKYFTYRNFEMLDRDEIQALSNMYMDKLTNIIYVSTPIEFKGSERVFLQGMTNSRKVKRVGYDLSKAKTRDMTMIDENKLWKYYPKIVSLE